MKKVLYLMVIAALGLFSCGNADSGASVLQNPASLKLTMSSETSATLGWDHNGTGVSGWWVYLRTASDAFHVQPLNYDSPLPASARSYEFTGLSVGATYDFGVQALAADPSSNSSVVYYGSFTVPVPEPEPGPEPTPGASTVTLTADAGKRTAEFKYVPDEGETVLVSLAPVSANNTVQIDRYEVGGEAFQSYTDWIGPYNMRTVAATSQTEKAWGFTGGWHASNGDATGEPTANTVSVEIYLDGEPFTSGVGTGSEAVCVVHNEVEAANTKFDESKRFVLDEVVRYTFKDGRLYVNLEATAREDVRITIYYGMQIAGGFSSRFVFRTDDGQEQEATQSFNMKGTVRDIIGYSAGGHSVKAHLDDEGLGTFSLSTPAYSALCQYYGQGNGKAYYMLIGDKDGSSSPYTLRTGETISWQGYYEFK